MLIKVKVSYLHRPLTLITLIACYQQLVARSERLELPLLVLETNVLTVITKILVKMSNIWKAKKIQENINYYKYIAVRHL